MDVKESGDDVEEREGMRKQFTDDEQRQVFSSSK